MKLIAKEIEVKVIQTGVVIELSQREAMILCNVLGRIGGAHEFRTQLIDPLYEEITSLVGRNAYFDFVHEHDWIKKDMAVGEKKQNMAVGEM